MGAFFTILIPHIYWDPWLGILECYNTNYLCMCIYLLIYLFTIITKATWCNENTRICSRGSNMGSISMQSNFWLHYKKAFYYFIFTVQNSLLETRLHTVSSLENNHRGFNLLSKWSTKTPHKTKFFFYYQPLLWQHPLEDVNNKMNACQCIFYLTFG